MRKTMDTPTSSLLHPSSPPQDFAAEVNLPNWQLNDVDLQKHGIKRSSRYTRRVVRGLKLRLAELRAGHTHSLSLTRERGWWLHEWMLVIVNLIQSTLLPLPIVFLAIWMQSVFSATTAFDADVLLTVDDLRFRPWLLFTKSALAHNSVIIAVFLYGFVAIALLELFFTYFHAPDKDLLSAVTILLRRKRLGVELTYQDAMATLKKRPELFPVVIMRQRDDGGEDDDEDSEDEDSGSDSGSETDSGSSDSDSSDEEGGCCGGHCCTREGCRMCLTNCFAPLRRCCTCCCRRQNDDDDNVFGSLYDTPAGGAKLTASELEIMAVLRLEEVEVESFEALQNDPEHKRTLKFMSLASASMPLVVAKRRKWHRRLFLAFRWLIHVLLPIFLVFITTSYIGYLSLVSTARNPAAGACNRSHSVYPLPPLQVGVWWLLGAILNPSQFLPLAAAVGTFAAVCVAKAKQAAAMRKQGTAAVTKAVQKQVAGLLANSPLGDMGGGLVSTETLEALADGDVSDVLKAAAAAPGFGSVMTQIKKTTASLGMDPAALVALAHGDPSALIAVATKNLHVC